MDWWPSTLKRVWALTGADGRTLARLRRCFEGAEEVNPAYRDHPETIWEHPVTALEPPQVGEVAEALFAVTPDAVRAVMLSDSGRIETELGKDALALGGDQAGQLAREHTVLRDFYEEAARRRLAIVLWWD